MRVLELCCGTKSFTKEAKARGHETLTIDIEPKFEPDICADIMTLSLDDLPPPFDHPDIIWASPPCTEFSKEHSGRPSEEAIALALHAYNLARQARFYVVENPQGRLCWYIKQRPFLVDQCAYGLAYKKPTHLWTNIPFIHRRCKHFHKHGRAGWGRDAPRSSKLRAVVASKLCEEILIACEEVA